MPLMVIVMIFFHNYPIYSMRVPPLINTDEQVKAEIKLLESLSDIEFALELLNNPDDDKHIVDITYERLHCNIVELDRDDKRYKVSIKMRFYIENMHIVLFLHSQSLSQICL